MHPVEVQLIAASKVGERGSISAHGLDIQIRLNHIRHLGAWQYRGCFGRRFVERTTGIRTLYVRDVDGSLLRRARGLLRVFAKRRLLALFGVV